MSQLLGSDFRLIPGESDKVPSDVDAMTRGDLFGAVYYAAEVLAKSDLCKTYGRAADPDDQDRYEQKRRHHWLRVLLAGSPRPIPFSEFDEFGLRWCSDNPGAWTINLTSAGVDIATDPVVPLQPDDRRSLADALLAIDVHGGQFA